MACTTALTSSAGPATSRRRFSSAPWRSTRAWSTGAPVAGTAHPNVGWRPARATWEARWASTGRSTAPTCSPARFGWRHAPARQHGSPAAAGSASRMRGPGRNATCASRLPMTRTSPAADASAQTDVAALAPGAAADAGTLRALEFAAIVDALAALTAFVPSRELALGTMPVADADHVRLLQDQSDEAVRLLDEQAQASIGPAHDVRAALERADRGGPLTPEELLEVAETLEATERFAARLKGWRGPHLAEGREALESAPVATSSPFAPRQRAA